MKPAPFDYFRPKDVAEASSALMEADGAAKLIAGGQSLGPMLNLRLVQPRLLVDISGIEELSDFAEDNEKLEIGACITAANIEDERIAVGSVPILSKVAGGIAHRAVRNRGTIGGSLCHADPAADWVSLLPALKATYRLASNQGTRSVAAEDFMTSAFETALQEGEVLQKVLIPKLSKGGRCGYVKISQKVGKFATAIGVVLSDPEQGIFRAVLGATAGKPIIVADAKEILMAKSQAGQVRIDQKAIIGLLAESGITAPHARQLHLVALERAAIEAFAS
jgi:aerobic carbon-monoxide dehydrogenase medium subunit